MVMHEQVWMLFTGSNQEINQIDSEMIYSFFRLLLDPVKMTSKKIAFVLDCKHTHLI